VLVNKLIDCLKASTHAHSDLALGHFKLDSFRSEGIDACTLTGEGYLESLLVWVVVQIVGQFEINQVVPHGRVNLNDLRSELCQ
jgi:hypothetical protein